MWIIPWNSFLMKVLMKKEVCESCVQCMGPTEKDRKTLKKKNADANAIISIQTITKSEKSVCLEKIKTWTLNMRVCDERN